jgi:Ca-activated chloride channel family protein
MHFARPQYLTVLWAIPVLAAFFLWSLRRRRRRLEAFISPPLAGRLAREFSRPKAQSRVLLFTGFFAFSILALARPQWGSRMDTVQRQGVDLIVALDTSYSMNAEDVAPSRMAKAKSEVRGLIERLKGDRVGLLAFAGTAVVQCPLTLDYGAAELFLDVANTGIVPAPGTSLAAAIQTATAAFIAREKKYKVLVIFTDGEDLEGEVKAAVEKAREAGVIIYTVGIGSPEGKPIPIRNEKGDILEYRKDPQGQVVVSKLDERALTEIASETGGRYFRATTSEGELDQIEDDVSHMEKKQLETRLYQNFEDRFQVPLALAVFCLAATAWITERRRPGGALLARLYSRTRATRGDI